MERKAGAQSGGTSTDQNPDGRDWAVEIVDSLENIIAVVRGKTTAPALKIVRIAVYALMAAGLGIATLLLLTIGAVRALDSYLPGEVWAAYLVLGTIFVLVGFALWRKRKAKS